MIPRASSPRPTWGRRWPIPLLFALLTLSMVALGASGRSVGTLPSERIVLANGLRVVVVQVENGPSVVVSAAYGVGTAFERRGELGAALALAEVLSEGARHLPPGTLPPLVAERGGRATRTLGARSLSFTSTYPENELPFALWLEADRLRGPPDGLPAEISRTGPRRRLGFEETVVLSQLRSLSALFGQSGASQGASSLTPDALRDFHRRYLTPNNGVLTIVGDVDARRTLALVHRYFEDIPRGLPLPPGASGLPAKGPIQLSQSAPSATTGFCFAYRLPEPWSPELRSLRVGTRILLDPQVGRLTRPERLKALGVRAVRAEIEVTVEGAVLLGLAFTDPAVEGAEAAFLAALEAEAQGLVLEEGALAPLRQIVSRQLGVPEVESAVLAQALALSTLADNQTLRLSLPQGAAIDLNAVSAALGQYLIPARRAVVRFTPEVE